MKTYMLKRPSMSLMPVCNPVYGASAILAAARVAPLSRVHQAQIQAELARVLAHSSNGNTVALKGRDGFVGGNGVSVKTDGASGVPPRGRPV
jgi:hypothetical protein